MNQGLNKCLRINEWMRKRHEKTEAKQRKLALYYAAKAWPDGGKPEPVWFHWFHNWTIGCEGWKDNVFAKKALDAWRGVGNGHYERRKRVWNLAMEKYVMGR